MDLCILLKTCRIRCFLFISSLQIFLKEEKFLRSLRFVFGFHVFDPVASLFSGFDLIVGGAPLHLVKQSKHGEVRNQSIN